MPALPESAGAGLPDDGVPPPPPSPPRPIAGRYVWHLLFSDGWAIASFTILVNGVTFFPLGLGLALARINLPLGIVFVGLGLGLMAAGGAIFSRRYGAAKRTVEVLRSGLPAEGRVESVKEVTYIRVNGRHPWVIQYTFDVGGKRYMGNVRTLSVPGPHLQPGRRIWALYLQDEPGQNVLYPHP